MAARVPQDATAASVPQDATAASVPQDATAASVPQDATAASVPQDATAASVTQDAMAASVAQDATAASVAQDATAASVAQDATAASVPQDATAASVPQDATAASVTQDATAASVAQDATAARAPHNKQESYEAMMKHPPTAALVLAVEEGDEAGVRSALASGGRPEVTIPLGDGESWCLVAVAARRGHYQLVPVLLQAGLSVEGAGNHEGTPLMHAAVKGHTQTLKVLLTHGANPLATVNDGMTALDIAAFHGRQQCVVALMPLSPPTAAHLEVDTPLHSASLGGQVEVLELLASAGWPLSARNSIGDTPLHDAVAAGHAAAVQRLVELGGDMRWENKAGHTPLDAALVSAVMEGDEAGVRSALARGGRPEVTAPSDDGDSWCLVTVAARRGHDQLVPVLLQAGLSVEGAGTDDRTPLMHAAEQGHTQTLKMLLTHGANHLATISDGQTALHLAAMFGHLATVECLVKQGGADPHMQDKAGDTPLDVAVAFGRHEVESWLLKNGGGGAVQNENERVKEVRAWQKTHEYQHNTVLGLVVAGDKDRIKAIIPEDFDGHALSPAGLTPLHAAALQGAAGAGVAALLRSGVSPHVLTLDNKTPAELAEQQGHHAVLLGLDTHQCAQSNDSPEHLHEELLGTICAGDIVEAVCTLLCKGAPIEPLGRLSVLRQAVTNDRARTVSLLLASGASLSAKLLEEAWHSPNVTSQVLGSLTNAYLYRLRAERRRLADVNNAFAKGIKYLLKTIKGNSPWQAAWRWGENTDRPALSDLLAQAAAANCPVTAAFLQRTGAWPFFSRASSRSALHCALEAKHPAMAKLLIKDLGGCPYVPDTSNCLPLHKMDDEDRETVEQELFEKEREQLKDMVIRFKADHEKAAAKTALCIQEALFESHKKGKDMTTILLAVARCETAVEDMHKKIDDVLSKKLDDILHKLNSIKNREALSKTEDLPAIKPDLPV